MAIFSINAHTHLAYARTMQQSVSTALLGGRLLTLTHNSHNYA